MNKLHKPTMSIKEATLAVDRAIANADASTLNYFAGQRTRYIHTLAHLPVGNEQQCALEVGSNELSNKLLKGVLGYGRVDCTIWASSNSAKKYEWNNIVFFNVNLEQELIQVADETYDLVICCEVLEHLSLDPMFMLAELNRVLKPNGTIFLTTPNITSSRAIWNVLRGDVPYLYHQYLKPISPGRHNLEYSPPLLKETMEAAGFGTEYFWTIDTFDRPVGKVIKLLNKHGFPSDMRGDNMFYIGRKLGGVRERYPKFLYDVWAKLP